MSVPIPFSGKGAMVWKIRDYAGAHLGIEDGIQQVVTKAKAAKLSWLALKIVDAYYSYWEGSLTYQPKQNKVYLPGLIQALRDEGITPVGWGYTYGWSRYSGVKIGHYEAYATVTLMQRYGLSSYLIDAEGEYTHTEKGTAEIAREYMSILRAGLPDAALLLCSYRYPESAYTFPWAEFLSLCDGHAPQVYWVGDNRPDGSALQLQESYRQLQAKAELPYFPIAPMYKDDYKGGWMATAGQLLAFLQEAELMGLSGAGCWCLDGGIRATMVGQLREWGDYEWGVEPPKLFDGLPPDEVKALLKKALQQLGLVDSNGYVVS